MIEETSPASTYKVKFESGRTEEFVYSPEFRTYMDDVKKQLRRNQYITLMLLIGVLILGILLFLLITQTGIVGRYLLNGVCKIL